MMSSRFEVIVSPLAVLNHPNHGAKTFEYRVSGEKSVYRYQPKQVAENPTFEERGQL